MTIQVVGIGLDGEAGLSESVRQIVDQATILVGSDRHLRYFPDHPAPRIILQDLTATLVEIQHYLLAFETNTPDLDPIVVVLVSGDPLFFGLGRLLLAKFPPEKLTFHPHLSSIQLAFNRVKIPWQDAEIISTHGRSFEQLTQALQQGTEKIAILTDTTDHTPKAIARLLSSLDLPTVYQFWVCENLGGIDERVQQWSIDQISTQKFASLNVVILLRESSLSPRLDLSQVPFFGIPDQLFCSFSDRPGLMTKREVRTLILGELALQPEQIIWDIGAGTGSVSIEIARLFANSTVYAVEKTAAGTALIEQNRERFQTNNVISIHGEAPAILHRLRAPHRIFIGGSGGNLEEILGLCSLRLIAGGTIVLALATLEHLNRALNWLENRIAVEQTWRYQLLQVQLSRSVPISSLTRFSPLNPVTILTIHHLPNV
ncbi:precorrin-6y C5,15-methyltransferase (decarboxylating) subunit CbiE [Limnoraphis robusta]|uniref:Precorrin-6y C5,15-methyltransferase (Decarboxylating) subunit CbiE n=1 Tax=Limnoraphis robusta CCNP1315 TaxID=3110306 RepID=A0ABU5TTX7_9CYAN|nr:precorrin-6y C5,15-methyltransferase (decarboxylating) subunit CbiE [Limnoraphis robusta]MEA5518091.1 precorrin-6y C5,15-methyltransferase (decarboxylating) subunit CbiE [Limnoraphis robusta CCNP1315]MEA5547287.1 precorrin-6y C5,15-methyltransferase (decarboxylating) subunit CbiE [Limnoraphis robusta CCNP1324]